MKIVCISDTHALHRAITSDVPDGDVLVHAGDITNVGSVLDIREFANWSKNLPHLDKIIIAGNHDFCFEKRDCQTLDAIRYLEDAGWKYLKDSSASVIDLSTGKEIKFYGSPWQPWFHDWAFNLPRGGEQLKRVWDAIPADTDVLITHGPPDRILDITAHDKQHVGCEVLSERIKELKNLKLHVFGHIHEGYGKEVVNGVTYVNASICDRDYDPCNAAIVVEL